MSRLLRRTRRIRTLSLSTRYAITFSDHETAYARPQVFVATTADVRLAGEECEASGDRVDQTVSDVDVAALGCEEVPDLIQVGFSLRFDAEGHQCDALRSAASRVRPR